MIELYNSVLTNNRTDERRLSVLKLVDILYGSRYNLELDQLEILIATTDEGCDITLAAENIVIKCAHSLLMRMGLTVDKSTMYNDIESISEIITAIITDVETFDDYDTMLSIVNNEDSTVMLIADLVAFITGRTPSPYIDIILDVETRTIDCIKNILTGRQLKDVDVSENVNHRIVAQVRTYLNAYPNSPLKEMLSGYSYNDTLKVMIDKCDIPHGTDDEEYIQQLALAVAGIAVTKWISFESAYEHLEDISIILMAEVSEINPLLVAKLASDMIDAVYITLDGGHDE